MPPKRKDLSESPKELPPSKRSRGVTARKESIARSTPKKKPKKSRKKKQSAAETLYSARTILEENETQYRIDWEPDPVTKKPYEPTWEPKEFANQDLIDDWNLQKEKQRASAASTPVAGASRIRNRNRRTIPDSPSEGDSDEFEEAEAEADIDSPLFVPQDREKSASVSHSRNGEPFVQVSQRSNFDADQSEPFSQLSCSETRVPASSPPRLTLQPNQPPKSSLGTFIAETQQSLPNSDSFEPSTQQESAQHTTETTTSGSAPANSTIDEISQWQPQLENTLQVPETEPIEEQSSPVVEQGPAQSDPIESVSQSFSSVSSPPPKEPSEKTSTQSQTQSGQTQSVAESHSTNEVQADSASQRQVLQSSHEEESLQQQEDSHPDEGLTQQQTSLFDEDLVQQQPSVQDDNLQPQESSFPDKGIPQQQTSLPDKDLEQQHTSAQDDNLQGQHSSVQDEEPQLQHSGAQDESLPQQDLSAQDESLQRQHSSAQDESLQHQTSSAQDENLLQQHSGVQDESLQQQHSSVQDENLQQQHSGVQDESLHQQHSGVQDESLQQQQSHLQEEVLQQKISCGQHPSQDTSTVDPSNVHTETQESVAQHQGDTGRNTVVSEEHASPNPSSEIPDAQVESSTQSQEANLADVAVLFPSSLLDSTPSETRAPQSANEPAGRIQANPEEGSGSSALDHVPTSGQGEQSISIQSPQVPDPLSTESVLPAPKNTTAALAHSLRRVFGGSPITTERPTTASSTHSLGFAASPRFRQLQAKQSGNSSSPVPSPPSQSIVWPDLVLSPKSPSQSNMSDRPRRSIESGGGATPSKLADSTQKRMKDLRAEREAKRRLPAAASLAGGTRSPSTIPSQPAQSTKLPEKLSLAGVALASQAGEAVSSPATPSLQPEVIESATQEVQGPPLSHMEFIVPLGVLSGSALANNHRDCILHQKKLISDFTNTDNEWSDGSPIIEEAQALVTKLKNVATHIDLLIPETTSQPHLDVQPSSRIIWDRQVSPKFNFLVEFLDAVRDHDIHVVLLADNTKKLLDLTEKIIESHNLNYTRPGNLGKSDPSKSKGSCMITLIPTNREGIRPIHKKKPADILIALDDSVDPENADVKVLRQHLTDANQLAPLVSPIVTYSIEHIQKCVTKPLRPVDTLKVVLGCVSQLRVQFGKLGGGYPDTKETAKEVARYVESRRMGETNTPWPLENIVMVDEMNGWISSQSTTSQSRVASPASTGVREASVTASKRHMSSDIDTALRKKPRVASPPAASASANDVTHVSETVIAPSPQVALNQKLNSQSLQRIRLLEENNKDISEKLDEAMTRTENDSEKMRKMARELRETKELLRVKDERLEGNAKRVEAVEGRLEAEKAAHNVTTAKLEAAQQSNLSSQDPLVAEVQSLQKKLDEAEEMIAKADERAAKAEKRTKSEQEQTEYIRGLYQEARDSAGILGIEHEQLQKSFAKMEKRANEVKIELRKLVLDDTTKATMETNKKLQLVLRDRELLLEKKDNELRTLKNGRGVAGGTRAATPKSPHVGPRGGSRANSPMPGGGRVGALRNAGGP
ncbi:hypothetical protein K402DRAFT_454184 [Aulographum hederae CBS 113979]|uniref:Chromo domain-containing protein n=1 Tax=Aulographum hederae CBS 113979 TaxID=1176131 RepID=A0A6G1GZY3_9PEZI|nr:hypothetical protein K402DRAFT_454184 [Aulographum hederae CBS 113979]